MNDYTKFLDLISKDQDLMVNLLIKWASINSGSYNYKGLNRMLNTIFEDFSVLPFVPESVELSDECNLPKAFRMVCRPQASIQILFNGHMDTVYGEDHYFQNCTKINDNILEGPGVTDMKGGLVIILEVLKIFEKSPWAKNIGWEILIVPDEEIGSHGSSHLLEVTAKRHTFGLIFEPCLPDGSLVRSRKGTGVFSIVARGKSGHAGRNFNKDDNAIVGLCNFLTRINQLNVEFPNAIFNIGHIEGGGPVNIIPDYAISEVGIRMSTFEEKKRIEDRLKDLVDSFNREEKVKIELSGEFNRPPKPPCISVNKLFQEIESCGRELGIALGWKDTGGASDGNNLAAAGLPTIDNLGVHGDNIHSEEEYVFLDSLTKRAQLTMLFLLKLASGEISLPHELFPNQRIIK